MLTRLSRPRRSLLLATSISLAACVGCGQVHAHLTAGSPRPVAVALPGDASALYAPIYTAQHDGDFTLGALSVTVSNSSSSQAALAALAAGHANIALASEPDLLAARAAGEQLVAIGSLTQGPLESIISLGSRPISIPRELAGQTVASSGTPLARAELETALQAGSVAPGSVRTVTVSGSLNVALQSHLASATLGGFADYDGVALALAHEHPSVLNLADAGVPSFSDLVIVVRMSEAHYDGPLLRAFLQSLTRGETATLEHPEAAAQLLARLNPRLSEAFELASLAATAPLAEPKDANDPFGYQDPDSWQSFGNWMADHGVLAHATNGALAITDEFLPGQGE